MLIISHSVKYYEEEIKEGIDDSDVNVADTTPKSSNSDRVYVKEVVSLGLLYKEFEDAILCEGDGQRVFRWWKYLLLVFNAEN